MLDENDLWEIVITPNEVTTGDSEYIVAYVSTAKATVVWNYCNEKFGKISFNYKWVVPNTTECGAIIRMRYYKSKIKFLRLIDDIELEKIYHGKGKVE